MSEPKVKQVVLEIRSGAGGDEAALFVEDLARMYKRYAQQKGWKFKVVNYSANEGGGYKTIVIVVQGNDAYDLLRNESGVHRVQRVPETEKSGRVHTSTATVAVLPVVKPKDVKIADSDLDISFTKSGGPGGQHVNKVETAVRIEHKPSGIVVSSESERSQARNREKAMSTLRSKLYDLRKRKKEEELGGMRKDQIGKAQRAEKIRTYNFPQNRITDHRINKKWKQLERIMEGELGIIMKEYKKKK